MATNNTAKTSRVGGFAFGRVPITVPKGSSLRTAIVSPYVIMALGPTGELWHRGLKGLALRISVSAQGYMYVASFTSHSQLQHSASKYPLGSRVRVGGVS